MSYHTQFVNPNIEALLMELNKDYLLGSYLVKKLKTDIN